MQRDQQEEEMEDFTEKRKQIWDELFLLSQAHLRATVGENWESWERIAKRKEGLYRLLLEITKGTIHQDEKEPLIKIKTLEEKIQDELIQKRSETKQKILRMRMTKIGVKGYLQGMKRHSRRHLQIKC